MALIIIYSQFLAIHELLIAITFIADIQLRSIAPLNMNVFVEFQFMVKTKKHDSCQVFNRLLLRELNKH